MAPPPTAAPALLLLIAIHLHRRRSKSPSPGMMAHGTKVPHPHLARPRSRVYPGSAGLEGDDRDRARGALLDDPRVALVAVRRAHPSRSSPPPSRETPSAPDPAADVGAGRQRLRSPNPANPEHPFVSDPPAILRVQRGPARGRRPPHEADRAVRARAPRRRVRARRLVHARALGTTGSQLHRAPSPIRLARRGPLRLDGRAQARGHARVRGVPRATPHAGRPAVARHVRRRGPAPLPPLSY